MDDTRISLAHGNGGRFMRELIEDVFARQLSASEIDVQADAVPIDLGDGEVMITTDGFTVQPLEFPGGDIGSLAVHGTINDVAMAGARPLYLSAGFVIEEGFPLADLSRIVASMAAASKEAGIPVVTGDTKVVERGKGDGVFITTTGVGLVPEGVRISADRARPGDAILVNGTIGDHGVAVMSRRENLAFETDILSDSAALHGLVAAMIEHVPGIRAMRDPTRGGLAATLNEIARQSGVGMIVREDALPVKGVVAGACELLGLDPLNVANEGKLVAFCPAEDAAELLAAMRDHPLGRDAAVIGQVVEDPNNFVQMETVFGGRRMVDWLAGEQLPRIC